MVAPDWHIELRLLNDLDTVFGEYVGAHRDIVRPTKEDIQITYGKYSIQFFRSAIKILAKHEEYELCQVFQELINEHKSN